MEKDLDKELDDLLNNLQLPSDEQIKRETTVLLRSKNPAWHKNNTERYKDPEYAKKVAATISAYYQTEEGRAKQAAKAHPCSESTKEKLRQHFTGKKRPQSVVAKLSDRAKGNQRRCKTIVTKLGTFSSKRFAAEAHTAAGIPNAMKKIDHWLKTDPENYYFIDKEGNRLPLEIRKKKTP